MAVSVAQLTSTPQSLFTSLTTSAITFLSFCNNDSGPVTINMYVVPAGETVGPTCLLYSNLTIPPYDTYQIYVGNEKLILGPADSIYCDATVDLVVNTVLSYTSL
jgi:hypothetical protein